MQILSSCAEISTVESATNLSQKRTVTIVTIFNIDRPSASLPLMDLIRSTNIYGIVSSVKSLGWRTTLDSPYADEDHNPQIATHNYLSNIIVDPI
jgi:hypothetical protein